jgi:ATP-binding cassette subfamily B multidrug efflux pump
MSINNFREDELTKEVIKRTTIKRLFKYMLAYKKVVGIVLSIMLVIITVTIVNPLFMEIAIDQYIANANYTGLFFIAGIALSINLLAMILSKIRIRLMAEVTNKILVQIRQELYEHIQKLSFNFFDKRPAGKILARVIGDVNALKDLLTNSGICGTCHVTFPGDWHVVDSNQSP